MISKQEFLSSCVQELNIIKHLYGKITPEMLDYRPSKKQRSMLELLQYISHFAKIEGQAIAEGKALTDFQGAMKQAYQMPADKFLAAMDEQDAAVRQSIESLSDELLAEPVDLFSRGRSQPRAIWFLNLILKSLVAYKMQLFLYLKDCGVHDIGTSNLWRGQDMEPKPPQEHSSRP